MCRGYDSYTRSLTCEVNAITTVLHDLKIIVSITTKDFWNKGVGRAANTFEQIIYKIQMERQFCVLLNIYNHVKLIHFFLNCIEENSLHMISCQKISFCESSKTIQIESHLWELERNMNIFPLYYIFSYYLFVMLYMSGGIKMWARSFWKISSLSESNKKFARSKWRADFKS